MERFMTKFKVDEASGCWMWQGYLDHDGYGIFRMSPEENCNKAIRAAWTLFRSTEIPRGWHLDHLCRSRACVNPDHLEPVLPQQNTDRGLRRANVMCNKGHLMTPENSGNRADGRRSCQECHRARNALRNAALRASKADVGDTPERVKIVADASLTHRAILA